MSLVERLSNINSCMGHYTALRASSFVSHVSYLLGLHDAEIAFAKVQVACTASEWHVSLILIPWMRMRLEATHPWKRQLLLDPFCGAGRKRRVLHGVWYS